MICKKCRKSLAAGDTRCPHCGEPNPETSGLFQTSTVLISMAGADLVYRSVADVPARLRTKLLKSTNSANSATILIADQRGRKEISKAMRNLPSATQRRLMHSVLGAQASRNAIAWLTPARKTAIVAIVALLALTVVALVFGHRWT